MNLSPKDEKNPALRAAAPGEFIKGRINDESETPVNQGKGHPNQASHDGTIVPHEQMSSPKVRFTLIANAQGNACKRFWINDAAKVDKQSAAEIYDGTATVFADTFDTFLCFRDACILQNQAFCYGIPSTTPGDYKLTTKARAGEGLIARSDEYFFWDRGDPGIMMLDYDPQPGKAARTSAELDAIFAATLTGFKGVRRAWRASSSAFIYAADGTEMIGHGGARCYLIVDDAAQIPRIGQLWFQELWKAGHGYCVVSTSGSVLLRSLIDRNVWQHTRLDFAAPPLLGEGLERRVPEDACFERAGSAMLASGELPEPMDNREFERSGAVVAARQDASPKADKVRARYVRNRRKALEADGHAVSGDTIDRAVVHGELGHDFVLKTQDGQLVTVHDLLSEPDAWDMTRFHDPLEPDYGNDPRIAVYFAQGGIVFSHAHGGGNYRLIPRPAELVPRTPQYVWTSPTVTGGPGLRSLVDCGTALERTGTAFSYDVFRRRVLASYNGGESIWIDDDKVLSFSKALHRLGWLFPEKLVGRAIRAAALANSFHPILDEWANLQWDGKPRLDGLLHIYCGANDTPLNRALGAIFLIAAVRRVKQPGCKFDWMLVLCGPEGNMKSMFFNILGGEFYTQSLPIGADDKITIERGAGYLICESQELDGMARTDVRKIKAAMTQTEDVARLAFGQVTTVVKRSWVFGGTTNEETPLLSDTGNRRFRCVDVVRVDVEALKRDRDQLWAEAIAREVDFGYLDITGALETDAQAVAESKRKIGTIEQDASAVFAEMVSGRISRDDLARLCGLDAKGRGTGTIALQDWQLAALQSAARKYGFAFKPFRSGGVTVRGFERAGGERWWCNAQGRLELAPKGAV